MRKNARSLYLGGFVFVMLLLFLSGAAFADAEWELAYAHDKDGNETAGCTANPNCSVNVLMAAIANGAEVRVSVHNHLMATPTTYYNTLSQVWISPTEPYVGGKRHVPLTADDPETIWATSSYYIDGTAFATYSGGETPIEDKTNYFAMEWFVRR